MHHLQLEAPTLLLQVFFDISGGWWYYYDEKEFFHWDLSFNITDSDNNSTTNKLVSVEGQQLTFEIFSWDNESQPESLRPEVQLLLQIRERLGYKNEDEENDENEEGNGQSETVMEFFEFLWYCVTGQRPWKEQARGSLLFRDFYHDYYDWGTSIEKSNK